MRVFFVVLFFALNLAKSYGQVTIPAEVAKYFLEQNDKALILEKKDSLNQEIIQSLKKEVVLKDSVIRTYEEDYVIYDQIFQDKNDEIEIYQSQLQIAEKDIRKQKFLKVSGFIGIGIITILALL